MGGKTCRGLEKLHDHVDQFWEFILQNQNRLVCLYWFSWFFPVLTVFSSPDWVFISCNGLTKSSKFFLLNSFSPDWSLCSLSSPYWVLQVFGNPASLYWIFPVQTSRDCLDCPDWTLPVFTVFTSLTSPSHVDIQTVAVLMTNVQTITYMTSSMSTNWHKHRVHSHIWKCQSGTLRPHFALWPLQSQSWSHWL